MSRIVYIVLCVVLLVAILEAFKLSLANFHGKNECPKLLGIPACYLVLLSFVLMLLAQLASSFFSGATYYFAFLAFPLLLALIGTLTELSGKVICPRTAGGTPMCYLSLAICLLLLCLKIAEQKL